MKKDPGNERTAADPLGGVSIDEITVAEIYLTSVGGVARAGARGREVLLRDGDRLADGDVDGIDFISPTVAWLRFRRRIESIPGLPYRPVVWLVVARGAGAPEALRLGDEDLLGNRGGFPPWGWVLSIEQAPRLVAEMLASSEARWRTDERRSEYWLYMKPPFGTVYIRFASRESRVRAMAAGGPAPSTCPERRLFSEIPVEDDGFSYDPGPRRDPFADLSAWTVPRPAQDGCHLPGLPGLLIDELEVEGLFMAPPPWGAMAEVRTARDFFFLREGDQLYDGDAVKIDPQKGVLFKQIVQDPTSLKPFRDIVKNVDHQRMDAAGVGRRDPFRSLVSGEAPAARPKSKLARLSCDDLAAGVEADQLASLLERADRRLARYLWEQGLVADRRTGRSSWDRRFLDDIAQSASGDLAQLFGELPGLEILRTGPSPPPAEMFAVLGDFNVIAGRLVAAIQLYRITERISPGQKTLCGRWHDGKLYMAESFAVPTRSQGFRRIWLTGYLIAWDPASDRIVERHLFPAMPKAFAVEQGKLRITLRGADVFEPAGQSSAPPVQVSNGFGVQWGAIQNGTRLAANFFDLRIRGTGSSFELRRDFDPRLPLDLPELERAARAAAVRDPTQPWHPFLLGQALWAQGRQAEAETLWNRIWDGGPWAAPYQELLWMAMLHESFGQRAWADHGFARVLAQRRRLGPPNLARQEIERRVSLAFFWLDGRLHDPERRYLWWRRLREISGIEAGDAFRAALWAAELGRRGEDRRAQDELAYLEQARRSPFDLAARSAWLDYSLYGVVACAAMLFAWLAALGGRLRRLKRCRRSWPSAARLFLRGLPQILIPLSLVVALSLTVAAANNVRSLFLLDPGLRDLVSARDEAPSDAGFLHRFTAADLLSDWATKGLDGPTTGLQALLNRLALEILIHGAGAWALLILAGFLSLFVIALPVGLLLSWGRARTFVTRWIPGAAQVRAGAPLRGYAVFGLFVFAVVPLAWLMVARVCGAVPAPGLVSANAFFQMGLESPLLPLSTPDTTSLNANFERLRTRSFARLLFVYPGARLFWSLVAAALAIALSPGRVPAALIRRLEAARGR